MLLKLWQLKSPKLNSIVTECTTSSPGTTSGITTVSVAVTGLERSPTTKKVRPKPCSPNRQGPQQCQVSTYLRKLTANILFEKLHPDFACKKIYFLFLAHQIFYLKPWSQQTNLKMIRNKSEYQQYQSRGQSAF